MPFLIILQSEEKVRRIPIIIGMFLISIYCYSQQNIPSKIIGRLPNIQSTQTYQIQVGAFKVQQNANNVFLKLQSAGFNPTYESYLDYTRVLITNISAGQVWNYLVKIKSLGFDEVIIREDKSHAVIIPEREELTEDIYNIIPPDKLDVVKELGIEIHDGKNPPNIEGTYFASALQLVKNTTGRNISELWNMYITFSEQDNTNLTINADYTVQTEPPVGTMSSKGTGSFIVGEGNKFTVFVDAVREQGGYTAKTVEIFTGEITAAGILNYYWAVMMIDDKGDPLNSWIENGTGYSKKDSDGFSERVIK